MPAFDLQNYISVQERINAFWKEHPDGAIRTQLASDPKDFDRCRYQAEVFTHRDHIEPDAVGYAFELAGTGMANKTSHEENCETSAIGRALANLGYATTQETRPSREEMTKVVRTEPKSLYPPREVPQPARSVAEEMQSLHGTASKHALSHQDLHDIAVGRGRGSLSELTAPELKAFNEWLKRQDPPSIQRAIDKGRETATAN